MIQLENFLLFEGINVKKKKKYYYCKYLLILAAAAGIVTPGGAAQKMIDQITLIKEANKITEKIAARELSRKELYEISPEYVHLLKIKEFPGIVVVGEHVTTHSATLRGVYVGSKFGTHQEQSAAAMRLAGWETADGAGRINLALIWAERVLFEFGGHFVRDHLHVFGGLRRPAYKKPEGEILKDRSVKINFWYRKVERGKSAVKTFNYMEVIFTPGGSLKHIKPLKSFEVSNQEFFRGVNNRPNRP